MGYVSSKEGYNLVQSTFEIVVANATQTTVTLIMCRTDLECQQNCLVKFDYQKGMPQKNRKNDRIWILLPSLKLTETKKQTRKVKNRWAWLEH